jgi:hypothetical protein
MVLVVPIEPLPAVENGKLRSHMLVVDQDEDDPLIRLSGQEAEEMVVKASRLTVARAMGEIGLNEVAIEMSLPPDVDADSELLLPSERVIHEQTRCKSL